MSRVASKAILMTFAIIYSILGLRFSMITYAWGHRIGPDTTYSAIISFLLAAVFFTVAVILIIDDKRG